MSFRILIPTKIRFKTSVDYCCTWGGRGGMSGRLGNSFTFTGLPAFAILIASLYWPTIRVYILKESHISTKVGCFSLKMIIRQEKYSNLLFYLVFLSSPLCFALSACSMYLIFLCSSPSTKFEAFLGSSFFLKPTKIVKYSQSIKISNSTWIHFEVECGIATFSSNFRNFCKNSWKSTCKEAESGGFHSGRFRPRRPDPRQQ